MEVDIHRIMTLLRLMNPDRLQGIKAYKRNTRLCYEDDCVKKVHEYKAK